MRYIAFILSFCVLTLALMPCVDAHAVEGNCKTAHEQTQDHPDSQQDRCSPFCICACCQTTCLVTKANPVAPFVALVELQTPDYTPPVPVSYPNNFWQPPKLA